MHVSRYMLAAVIATFAFVPAAHATTLINDPAHPFPAKALVRMQHWLDVSAEPTPSVLYVHRGECPGSVACANMNRDALGWFMEDGHIWTAVPRDRFAFIHEVGHVVDAEMYTDAKRVALERLLHMQGEWRPDARFDPGTTPPFERAADAYAMCSLHPRWPGTWWHFVIRRRHGVTIGGGNPTPYDFRAGRVRYHQICAAIRRSD